MDSFNRFENGESQLPPGFRFHPTDEELITYYLMKKVLDSSFTGRAIAEVDINKCEPWELPEKAKMGEKEWYVFSLRDRKYPTGLRTNRATESVYWKATGKDRVIYSSRTGTLVGMKKTLVFYKGRAPKGEKSNWVMHEYRLEGKFSYHNLSKISKDEWVVSRIFEKSGPAGKKNRESTSSYTDISSPSLPALIESSSFAYGNERESCCSYESEASREHVPCFSTAAGPRNHHQHRNATVSSNFRPVSNLAQMSVGQFLAVPPLSENMVSAFPSPRSLQENLQFPFFFSAMAPAAGQPTAVADSGQWPESGQKVAGNWQQLSELDCFPTC